MVSKVRENVKDFLNALFSVLEPQNYPNEINEATDSVFVHFSVFKMPNHETRECENDTCRQQIPLVVSQMFESIEDGINIF